MLLLDLLAERVGHEQGLKPTAPLDSRYAANTKNQGSYFGTRCYAGQTMALTQRIDDVDTAQVSDEPAGWETPTGGGLHLVTDFEHDNHGHITQTLGPVHTVDIDGTATSVRRATWTV